MTEDVHFSYKNYWNPTAREVLAHGLLQMSRHAGEGSVEAMQSLGAAISFFDKFKRLPAWATAPVGGRQMHDEPAHGATEDVKTGPTCAVPIPSDDEREPE